MAFVAAHEVADLVADVLEAPTATDAQGLLVARDGVTAARAAVVLASIARVDRVRLADVVKGLRATAAAGREIEALDAAWGLPAAPAGRGPDDA